MLENLLQSLGFPTADIQGRSEGAAFLKVAREAYPLKSLEYVVLNLPVAGRPSSFIHCTYSDRWVKHCISRTAADARQLNKMFEIFRSTIAMEKPVEEPAGHPVDVPSGQRIAAFPLRATRGEAAALFVTADAADAAVLSSSGSTFQDLRVLANHFHQQMLRIYGHVGAADPLISSREVDCLKWIAAGKTAWETSVILGISERTVRFHLNAAREKLNCATTTQAVAKAVADQLLVV